MGNNVVSQAKTLLCTINDLRKYVPNNNYLSQIYLG